MIRCCHCKRLLPESKFFYSQLKRGDKECKDCLSIKKSVSAGGQKKVQNSDFNHLKKREIDKWI